MDFSVCGCGHQTVWCGQVPGLIEGESVVLQSTSGEWWSTVLEMKAIHDINSLA